VYLHTKFSFENQVMGDLSRWPKQAATRLCVLLLVTDSILMPSQEHVQIRLVPAVLFHIPHQNSIRHATFSTHTLELAEKFTDPQLAIVRVHL